MAATLLKLINHIEHTCISWESHNVQLLLRKEILTTAHHIGNIFDRSCGALSLLVVQYSTHVTMPSLTVKQSFIFHAGSHMIPKECKAN